MYCLIYKKAHQIRGTSKFFGRFVNFTFCRLSVIHWYRIELLKHLVKTLNSILTSSTYNVQKRCTHKVLLVIFVKIQKSFIIIDIYICLKITNTCSHHEYLNNIPFSSTKNMKKSSSACISVNTIQTTYCGLLTHLLL